MSTDHPFVMMLGSRGCPDLQGGVERHIEELAPRLVALGCRVEVLGRAPYLEPGAPRVWRDVTITPLACPRRSSTEALVHTLVGVVYAARHRPDLVHIHAIGPALLVPLARLLGLRVVVTHHGFDYERAKWGRVARVVLKVGEQAGMRFASARIAVSEQVANVAARRFGVPVSAIPNGVVPRSRPTTTGAPDRFGLEPGRYVLLVARLVPEKRHLDLIKAFARAAPAGWHLVLVGGADHPTPYSRAVLDAAARTPQALATGSQSGLALVELIAHAGLFVLPSSHEGLPIALLEALAFGIPALASDIPANREIGLAPEHLFPVGDLDRLARLIARACAEGRNAAECDDLQARVARDNDWDRIAARTLDLYRAALGGSVVLVPIGAASSQPAGTPRPEPIGTASEPAPQ